MNIKGYKSALDAVLSGEFELCISTHAFIRSAVEVGSGDVPIVHNISFREAIPITKHKCVKLSTYKSTMYHYRTRSFPVVKKKG